MRQPTPALWMSHTRCDAHFSEPKMFSAVFRLCVRKFSTRRALVSLYLISLKGVFVWHIEVCELSTSNHWSGDKSCFHPTVQGFEWVFSIWTLNVRVCRNFICIFWCVWNTRSFSSLLLCSLTWCSIYVRILYIDLIPEAVCSFLMAWCFDSWLTFVCVIGVAAFVTAALIQMYWYVRACSEIDMMSCDHTRCWKAYCRFEEFVSEYGAAS